VFLDKDGTLVVDVPYNVDPELIRLAPGAMEGLLALHAAGYALIVVSNQSGVARGLFAEEALGTVADYAVRCDCRKPEPGLVTRAAADHGVDLARSWLVGDILNDVEAGRRTGCRTVLIDNGNETEWRLSPDREPHHVAADLAEAARIITQHAPAPGGGPRK
jgi:HAD superfamily hydrolase (TIGR01662 family)